MLVCWCFHINLSKFYCHCPFKTIDLSSMVFLGVFFSTRSKLQWPRCNWEFQCRGTGHSVKFNWFPVNFHWFPVEFHWISSGIPRNFPMAPRSLITSDFSLVLAKSVNRGYILPTQYMLERKYGPNDQLEGIFLRFLFFHDFPFAAT